MSEEKSEASELSAVFGENGGNNAWKNKSRCFNLARPWNR